MIDKQLKILLLGGTGAIGSHLSEILSTQGHLIFITSRKNRVENLNIKYIKGNAQDFSFLSRLLAQNEYDVCVDFMSYATHEFSKRVELLLDSVGQYVYISSARVYLHIPADTRSAFPVISVQSPVSIQCCWQS